MPVLQILKYGDKRLKKQSLPIQTITAPYKKFAYDMLQTMYARQGIGLAAIQCGQDIRLIVVDVDWVNGKENPYIIFNPEIIDSSGISTQEEGCLSIPGVNAEVTRPDTITVSGYDRNGQPLLLENISGMLARCILHEVDHLNGVLFVDKISETDKAINSGKLKKLASK